jgi:cell wall integrity and stress response component
MTATMPAGTALSVVLLLFTLLSQPSHGLVQEYCSNQNSASDLTPSKPLRNCRKKSLSLTNWAAFWEWQSNGWCHDHCAAAGHYVFAIVQDGNCWCSNLAPSNQQDVDDCSDTCPGFGQENCGNKDHGLFGYIAISGKASGTFSGSPASPVSGPLLQLLLYGVWSF